MNNLFIMIFKFKSFFTVAILAQVMKLIFPMTKHTKHTKKSKKDNETNPYFMNNRMPLFIKCDKCHSEGILYKPDRKIENYVECLIIKEYTNGLICEYCITEYS